MRGSPGKSTSISAISRCATWSALSVTAWRSAGAGAGPADVRPSPRSRRPLRSRRRRPPPGRSESSASSVVVMPRPPSRRRRKRWRSPFVSARGGDPRGRRERRAGRSATERADPGAVGIGEPEGRSGGCAVAKQGVPRDVAHQLHALRRDVGTQSVMSGAFSAYRRDRAPALEAVAIIGKARSRGASRESRGLGSRKAKQVRQHGRALKGKYGMRKGNDSDATSSFDLHDEAAVELGVLRP